MGINMGKWTRAFYQPVLPLGEDGRRVTGSREHIQLSKEAAKEGMVLLKNEDRILPLKKGAKVALFGKATFDYVKGGGGSGDVTVAYTRNLYEGFREVADCVSVYEELASFYRENVAAQYAQGIIPGQTAEPAVPVELVRKARAYTDTAVISICRFSGEGWDRDERDFELTAQEQAMVDAVCANFDKVIAVLNVGGMMATDWFKENPRIQSVLLAWQGGIEGGLAAAELLVGKGNPSGKLSDTLAKKLEDYPSSYNFHENEGYVDYTEDVYVGYRYFETFPQAREKVNYPFGFGLSYTNFTLGRPKVEQQGQTFRVMVEVCNTGEVPGKEVVQVYYSAPQGKLGKPSKELVAFRKTRLLAPGESQMMVLYFTMKDLASYDDLGKVAKSAYVLEKGEYHFHIGTSLRDTMEDDFVLVLQEDVVAEQLSAKLVPNQLKKRLLSDGSYEELPLGEPVDTDANALERMDMWSVDGFTPLVKARGHRVAWAVDESKRKFIEVANGTLSMEEFMAQLTDEELAELLGGQPNTGVANVYGYGNIPDYGVPNVMTADGPAGLRILPECGVYTTAWPCSTMLACTWNVEVLETVGRAAALELKENNIAAWLAPAINIHRSPLCGRNFEYYSEDPFLTGKLAAAMVKGIQSNHIAATVKHFALNNKETNRKNSDSRISERAAREIYLKAFEIIVKEAQPWCIMSSYNIINGHRASECRELLEDILRGEWGFEGMVTTDWWTGGEHYKETLAGNDVKMGCGFPDRLLAAFAAGVLTRKDLEICARRVLELILKID